MDNLFKLKEKEKKEIKVEKQQEMTFKWVGRILPHRGQRVFARNVETGEIKEVEPKPVTDTIDLLDFVAGKLPPQKIDVEQGWEYICALNVKNAVKHFNKGTTGGIL